jgi:Phytanoyl-CoA dioxygenase (PhyH)
VGAANNRPTHFSPGAGYYDIALPDPPDIEHQRSDNDIVGWDMEPGDCVARYGLTLHSSQPNYTGHGRRVLGVRFTGPDVTYVPRPGAIAFSQSDVEPGSRFENSYYPRAWPPPAGARITGAPRHPGGTHRDSRCDEPGLRGWVIRVGLSLPLSLWPVFLVHGRSGYACPRGSDLRPSVSRFAESRHLIALAERQGPRQPTSLCAAMSRTIPKS